ncbi:MAG: serine hydrolase [Pseudomonadota bacterium]
MTTIFASWLRLLALFPLCAALAACGSDGPAPRTFVPPINAQPGPFDTAIERIDDGDFGRIEAVLVEQSGEIVVEKYFRNSTAQSRIDVRSVGKSITALAVGAAIEDGALPGVETRVWDYLTPNTPVAGGASIKDTITVADLLSMSSPLDCNDWVSSSPGKEEKMYRKDNWTQFALNLPIDPMYRKGASGQGRFSYCTAGVFLLGQVVERAVGKRFDAYVQDRLFAPIGIPGADWRTSPSGEVQSGGQLGIRPRDLMAVGRLVLNAGEHQGQSVISRDWLRTMLTPKVGATPDMDYAYLWWSRFFNGADGRVYGGAFMLGNGGNLVLLLPEIDTVIVVAATNYNRDTAFEDTIRIVEGLLLPALMSPAQ